jgi:aspartate/methionine/tyrosine aminotransferase
MAMTIASPRMAAIPFSGIRQIAEVANQLERAGRDIVHLTIGRPDFDTPTHIKEAAKEALDHGFVHDTSNYGIPELRQAIADKLRTDNAIEVDPASELLVVSGVSQAIAACFLGLLGPGDEVLVPTPAYLNYLHCATLAGAVAVPVPLRPENGFQPDPDEVAALITPRTRMLVLVSPNNPTGAVWPALVLRRLADLVAEHELLLLSDEIYEKLVYSGHQHFSVASLPQARNLTLTLNGFSKAFSMTGWRLGYIAAAEPLINVLVRVIQYIATCPNSFAQWGAVAALCGTQEPVEEMRTEFDRRRQLVQERLRSMPGVQCPELQGAFYAFSDISALGLPDEEFAEYFLRHASVAVVPGSAFGEGGAGHIRISYACSYDRLQLGLDRLENACFELGSKGRQVKLDDPPAIDAR